MTSSQQREDYLQHILSNIPHKPGVYKMKDAEGQVIYVGKAKDLKHRVSSYFQSRTDKVVRTVKMVEQIADIEYIIVDTELEALLLETNFIKELRPKYNILMKDDKNYVYIKITVDELFPRIFLTRKVLKDRARYFGPKTAAHKVIKTLKVLKQLFPFRHCQLQIDSALPEESERRGISRYPVKVTKANIKYPCLDYHIKRCIGPCIGTVSPEEYRGIIDQVIRFLEGKHEQILDRLKADMVRAAEEKKFEKAAALRDKMKNIEEILETQRISDPHQKDLDIIHYVIRDEKAYFNLFQLREGKLVGQENFILAATGATDSGEDEDPGNEEVLGAFLEQYYEKATDLPKEILVPHEVDEKEALMQWLSEQKGQKVALLVPERGKKNQLLELSLQNARSFAKQSLVKWQGTEKGTRQKALEDLQNLLQLPKLPRRLECYDISHFGGTETVSSMVVFENGFPLKNDYRKFKLHQQEPGAPNDFASMEETLLRRLKYLKPALAKSGISIRKAKKKERAEFLIPEGLDSQIFIFEKEKKREGFMEIIRFPGGKVLLRRFEAAFTDDHVRIFRFVLTKYKVKRLYAAVSAALQPAFEASGFELVKKIPDEFSTLVPPEVDVSYLVFDRNKYQEDRSFGKTPDLIIIDGGKGQLGSALLALQHYGLQIPMISIAKKEEELFVPGRSESIRLAKDDPISLLIQHIRDEAHRFAVSYHQNLRGKDELGSVLDTLEGIGPKLKLKLLKRFGSVEGIRQASEDELAEIVGESKVKILKKI